MYSVYDLWLSEIMLRFPKDVRAVCERYASSYEAFSESLAEISREDEISERCMKALMNKNLTSATALLEKCVRQNIAVVPYFSELYPQFLKEIESPPFLLYVKGDVRVLRERFCISTVGTRRMSSYGKYYAFKISYEAASAGAVIVSGMARGIDSVTHAGALAAGGKTVAVLGCGVDVVYPKEHQLLYNKIIESGGAVISEYLLGTSPYPQNFPHRNRIICGMSYATVVIEAPKQSGALITACEAIKEGRTVFALPGNLNEESSYGTNELISGGARLIRSTEELLCEYRGISNINIDFGGYRNAHPTAEMCDGWLEEYKVTSKTTDGAGSGSGRTYTQRKTTQTIPSKKKPQYEESNAGKPKDFPFSIFQSDIEADEDNKFYGKKRSTKTNKDKTDDTSGGENVVKTETAERTPIGYEQLVLECESLGVEMNDDIRKVCRVLSENEKITVDTLHASGCSTKASLQALTILVQTGRLIESAGGIYVICKE